MQLPPSFAAGGLGALGLRGGSDRAALGRLGVCFLHGEGLRLQLGSALALCLEEEARALEPLALVWARAALARREGLVQQAAASVRALPRPLLDLGQLLREKGTAKLRHDFS